MVKLSWIPAHKQIANGLTKGLGGEGTWRCRYGMGMREIEVREKEE
jgi:hypothetical protein